LQPSEDTVSAPALSTPLRNPTADTALRNVARTERPVRGPLTYTLTDVLAAKKAAGAISGFEAMLLRLAERAAA
jgi:hypothetical protein